MPNTDLAIVGKRAEQARATYISDSVGCIGSPKQVICNLPAQRHVRTREPAMITDTAGNRPVKKVVSRLAVTGRLADITPTAERATGKER